MFAALAVATLASCAYGPTGILAGIEEEQHLDSLVVNLDISKIQSFSVSGNQAVVSGGEVYVRNAATITSKWKKLSLPGAATTALAAATDGTNVHVIVWNNSGTKFYSAALATPSTWTNVAALDGAQAILNDGIGIFVVVRDNDGLYDLYDEIGAHIGGVPGYAANSAFPFAALNVASTTFLVSQGALLDLDGDKLDIGLFSGRSILGAGVYDDGGTQRLVLGTGDGRIYLSGDPSDDADWKLIAEVETNGKEVPFTNSIEYDDTLLIGTRGFGYYVVSDIDYGNGTSIVRRATSRSLSNILDTKVWNATIKGFAPGPTANSLYFYTANNGLWLGEETNGTFEWKPLTAEE